MNLYVLIMQILVCGVGGAFVLFKFVVPFVCELIKSKPAENQLDTYDHRPEWHHKDGPGWGG